MPVNQEQTKSLCLYLRGFFSNICLVADASYGNVTKEGTPLPDPLSTLCRPKGKMESKHLLSEVQEAALPPRQPLRTAQKASPCLQRSVLTIPGV